MKEASMKLNEEKKKMMKNYLKKEKIVKNK